MRPAGADQTGNPDHLAAAQRQRFRSRRQILDADDDITRGPRTPPIQILEAATHHQADDGLAGRFRRDAAARVAAVSQYHEAIGNRLHFFDEVRDVDDGQAARLEASEQIEQRAHVGVTEAARRLVEDEDAAPHRERPRDFHELLRRRLEIANGGIWRDVGVAELLERRPCRVAHLVPSYDAAPHGFDAQHDVFHHAEVRRQRQFLVDHRDAGPARVERIARRKRLAGQPHRAAVRRERACENRHQRALARAVLADERAHLARRHREIDRVERDGRAKRLADAAHLEQPWIYFLSHRDRSGCRSSLASGSFMRSRVIRRTPVSTRASTFSPRRCAAIVFTPR